VWLMTDATLQGSEEKSRILKPNPYRAFCPKQQRSHASFSASYFLMLHFALFS
jgi:hypothetical protein